MMFEISDRIRQQVGIDESEASEEVDLVDAELEDADAEA